jgi:hypothetical protein
MMGKNWRIKMGIDGNPKDTIPIEATMIKQRTIELACMLAHCIRRKQ